MLGSRLAVYAAALNTAALLALIAVIVASPSLPAWWVLLGVAMLATTAELHSVSVTRNSQTSVSFLPLVVTAVAFGPLAALIVGAVSNLGDLWHGRSHPNPHLRWAVYTAARALTGAAAGTAALASNASGQVAFTAILLASLSAAVANHVADTLFNVVTLAVRRTAHPFGFVRAVWPYLVVSLPIYVPLVALLVYLSWEFSVWIGIALLAVGVALQRLLVLYQDQRETSRRLADVNERLVRANISFASALVATVDARDEYTAGHSAAVAMYARDIARQMGLCEADQELAHLCGLVHDVGKIGLPARLLEKPGPLTLDERRQMETHSAVGERILANVEDYGEIARIVRHHHERVDGHGYPDRLVGTEIPLISRILAVADAYDAMTSDRPYRDAMPSHVARLRIAQAVESHFDTTFVAAFEAIFASESEAFRFGPRYFPRRRARHFQPVPISAVS